MLAATCVVVGQVQDGVSALAAAATPPDVIVLDISMPGMTGLDVAAGLRAAGSTAAIVFLTAPTTPSWSKRLALPAGSGMSSRRTSRQICCTPSTRHARGAPSSRFAGHDKVP